MCCIIDRQRSLKKRCEEWAYFASFPLSSISTRSTVSSQSLIACTRQAEPSCDQASFSPSVTAVNTEVSGLMRESHTFRRNELQRDLGFYIRSIRAIRIILFNSNHWNGVERNFTFNFRYYL